MKTAGEQLRDQMMREILNSREARGMYQDQAWTSTGYAGGLTDEERGLGNKPAPINENPYPTGTFEHESWKNNYKEWASIRDLYFGASVDGKSEQAKYYNKDIKGIFSDGDWQSKPFSEYSSKAQKEIIEKRKLIAQYAKKYHLYSDDDWDSFDIKDEKIKNIWENNKDIKNNRSYMYDMLNGMDKYKFDLPGINDYRPQRQFEAPLVKDPRRAIDSPVLYNNSSGILEQPDPLDTYDLKNRPINGGAINPNASLNAIQTLQNDFNSKAIVTPTTGNKFLDASFKTDFQNDSIKDNTKTSGYVSTLEDKMYNNAKHKRENAIDNIIGTDFDNYIFNNIDIDYDKNKKKFTYNLKKGSSYENIEKELKNTSQSMIETIIDAYAEQKGLTAEQKQRLKDDQLDITKIKEKGFFTKAWDSIKEDGKSIESIFSGTIFNNKEQQHLPPSIGIIAKNLNDRLEDLRVLKARNSFGRNELEIPDWVNPDDMTLSGLRGMSPSIINKPIASITKKEDFDIASFAKNLFDVAYPQMSPEAMRKMGSIISDPRKIFSKEYTDSEVLNSLVNIYMRKYNVSDEDARKQIQSSYKDINKSMDTWSYTTYNTLNAMSELTGELIVPFRGASVVSEKLLERGAFVKDFVANSNIGKVMKLPAFEKRALQLQRFLEGSSEVGGKTMPYFDEVFGFIPKNVARNTLASFGTQMFWHGADVDESLKSAENMFVLELLNNTFALAGVRAYKFYNAIGKGIKGIEKTRTGTEALLLYNKRLNAIHGLSTFPAQGVTTKLMNPDADTKEFASEMFMNLMMSGNNIMTNRRLAKDIKDFRTNINDNLKRADNWASKSPNRKIEVVTDKELEDRLSKQGEDNKTAVLFKDKEMNPMTREYEDKNHIITEVKQGFYDYAKQRTSKTEAEPLEVRDFSNIVKENVAEEYHPFIDKILENASATKIAKAENLSNNAPAYFDKDTKTIYINNNVTDNVDDNAIARAILHEGGHALTNEHYDNDPQFKENLDNIIKELYSNDSYIGLKEKLSESNNVKDKKALYDIQYAEQSGHEMMSLMFDPGMKEGRDAINSLTYGENNKTFKDRFWNGIKSIFKRTEGNTPAEDNALDKMKDLILNYDFSEGKEIKVNEEETPPLKSEDEKIPLYDEEGNPTLFDEIPDFLKANEQTDNLIKEEVNKAFDVSDIKLPELQETTTISNIDNTAFNTEVNTLIEEKRNEIKNEINKWTESFDNDAKSFGFDDNILMMPELANNEFIPVLATSELETLYNETRKKKGLLAKTKDELLADYRAEYKEEPTITSYKAFLREQGKKLISDNYENYTDFMSYLGEEILKDNELDRNATKEIKVDKSILGYGSRETLIDKLAGKPFEELYPMIKEKLSDIYKSPSQQPLIDKLAVMKANELSQMRNADTFVLYVDNDNNIQVSRTRSQMLDNSKKIDRTQGTYHSLNNYVEQAKNSLYSETGEMIPYASDKIEILYNRISSDKIQKVVGVFDKGVTNKSLSDELLNEKTASQLLQRGIYLLPRGAREDVAMIIDGVSNLINNNPERAIEYARDIAKYSFFKWIDSDSQWLGSKEGVYKGRELATLANKLDFDKMTRKYVLKENLKPADLITDKNLKPNQIELMLNNIDLIGKKLHDYYRTAKKETIIPEYYKNMTSGKTDTDAISRMMVNSITDLITWGIDTGGGSRTIKFNKEVVDQVKSPWKYHSQLFSNSNVFLTKDYAKAFLPHLLDDNKEFDTDKLRENGIHINQDGELAIKRLAVNPNFFSKNPMLHKTFQEMAFDGGSLSMFQRLFNNVATMMGANPDNIGLIKPKGYSIDRGNNMSMYKTGYFDYGKKDKYMERDHPELNEIMDNMKKSASILTFPSSIKGSSSFRYREEDLRHDDIPNAKALFDNKGNIVDVIVKDGTQIKSDLDLLSKEIDYVSDNFAKGIVDDRFIQEVPITGKKALAFIETSHPSNTKNAGSFGVNQVPMASPYFHFFTTDDGKGWNAIKNFEQNIISNKKRSIESLFGVRKTIEDITEAMKHIGKGNIENANKIKNRVLSDGNLTKVGGAITDILDDLHSQNHSKLDESSFELPGITVRQVIDMLESTIDGEGKFKPQETFKLMLAGNMFVSGMKFSDAGQKTMVMSKMKNMFEDALKTRGYGTNLTVMPDMYSKAAVSRFYEPLIEKIGQTNEREAKNLAKEYQEMLANNIDEHGRLKPFSDGLILGYDVIKKFNLKPGQTVFLKLTPSDDLHTIVPVKVIGEHNKPGMMTYNTEYMTGVVGRDFDKDAMSIIVQDDKYISKEDFDNLADLYRSNSEGNLSMLQGKYKLSESSLEENEKNLVNGDYEVLGKGFTYHDPTMTPQSDNYYDKVQKTHSAVDNMIARRNKLSNAINNIEWRKENGMYVADITPPIKDATHSYKLKYDVATEKTAIGFANRMNYIIQKMVDTYNFSSINPMEAIYEEFLVSKDDGFGEITKREDMTTEEKKAYIDEIDKYFSQVSGSSANRLKRAESLKEFKTIKKADTEGQSLFSKVNRMVKDLKITASNKPEVAKYLFYNKIGEQLRTDVINVTNDLRKASELQTKDKELTDFLFPMKPDSEGRNLPHLLGKMFTTYTQRYLKKNMTNENRENLLRKDFFPHIELSEFKAFQNKDKYGWKEILTGSILHDIFENNTAKDHRLVDKRIYQGIGYRSEKGEGILVEFAKNPDGTLDMSNIKNSTNLSDIFDYTGKLMADWIPPEVLNSKWLRTDLVERKNLPSDKEKANTIGRVIGNLSNYISSVTGLDADNIFTALAFNNILQPGASRHGYDVNTQIREGRTKDVYVNQLIDWQTGMSEAQRNSLSEQAIRKDPKMKEVIDKRNEELLLESHKMVDNELRYDPLELVNGAREVGVSPKVNNKDYFDYMNDYASNLGKNVFGEETGIENGNLLFMPGLSWIKNDLDIRSPEKFVSSIEKEAKKQGLDINRLLDMGKEEYKELYDKVLVPKVKKLIGETSLKLSKDDEVRQQQLLDKTLDYLYTYSPESLSREIDDLNYLVSKSNGIKKVNHKQMSTVIGKRTGKPIMSSSEFMMRTLYLDKMTDLGRALNEQFTNKEGSRKSFHRIFKGRTHFDMARDYTAPQYMQNYKGSHIIMANTHSKNGFPVTTKEGGIDLKKNVYKISDFVDRNLNVSLAGRTIPKSYVEYVIPRQILEDIADMGQVNINSYIDTKDMQHDVRGSNNDLISKSISALISDDDLYREIQEAGIETYFNGLTKDKKSTVRVSTTKEALDKKGKAFKFKEMTTSTHDDNFKHASQVILDKIHDRQRISEAKKDLELKLADPDYHVTEDELAIRESNRIANSEDKLKTISTLLGLKVMAKETADNLVSMKGSLESMLEMKKGRLNVVDQKAIIQQIDNLTKHIDNLNGGITEDNINSKDLKDKLRKENLHKMFNGLGAINFDNKSTMEKLLNEFYNPAMERLDKYSEYYDKKEEPFNTPEFLLSPEKNPDLYKKLDSQDKMPFFEYMNSYLLKLTTNKEMQKKKFLTKNKDFYMAQAEHLLKQLFPDLDQKSIADLSAKAWDNSSQLTGARFTLNENIYQLGHELKIPGFSEPIDKAKPETVFKKGYMLKKEVLKQFENEVRKLQDEPSITMSNREFVDKPYNVYGVDIDLSDFILASAPHLKNDKDFFSYSLSNYKDKLKGIHNKAIAEVETLLKTMYLKEMPDDNLTAQHIVLGELGQISGNQVMYNRHYGKKDLDRLNEVEAGTDSFIRYTDVRGQVKSVYGRIMGERNIPIQYVNDAKGNPRIMNKDFVFLSDDKSDTKKMYVIDKSSISDVVAGSFYGNDFSTNNRIDRSIKEEYGKHIGTLLDQLVEPLSKKSKYAKMGSEKDKTAGDRKEDDSFLLNPDIDQRLEFKDYKKALELFSNNSELMQDNIDKAFGNKLANMQKTIRSFIVADSYLGLRYINKMILSGGTIAIATAGLTLGMINPLVASPLITVAGAYGMKGGAKYFSRIARLLYSNAVGVGGWLSRNPNGKAFVIGNIGEILKSISSSLSIKGRYDVGESPTSRAMSEKELLKLSESSYGTRVNEFLDDTFNYESTAQERGKIKAIQSIAMRENKKTMQDFKDVKQLFKDWQGKSEQLGFDEPLEAFKEELINRYKDKDIDVVNGIVYINGKSAKYYQSRDIGLMTVLNHLLSFQGKMVEYEVRSHANATKGIKNNLREFYTLTQAEMEKYAPTTEIFQHNLTKNLLEKSIGAYTRSPYRKEFSVRLSQLYSDFSHTAKIDQTTGLLDRWETYKVINKRIKADPEFQDFMSFTHSIPKGGYKINDPRREFGASIMHGFITYGLKFIAGAVGNGVILNTLNSIFDKDNTWFGLSFVNSDLMKLVLSIGTLGMLDEGKSPNSKLKDIAYSTTDAVSGFTGYGVTQPLSTLSNGVEMLWYNYYYDGLSGKDRRKITEYYEQFQLEQTGEAIGNLIPVPMINVGITDIPKMKTQTDKEIKSNKNKKRSK